MLAAATAALTIAVGAGAQSVPDDAPEPGGSAASLNLPTNLQMFGKFDPDIRKATAIVNGAIITDTDVDQRLALVLTANGNKVEGDERDRLRLQVLRNLIERDGCRSRKPRRTTCRSGQDEIDATYNRVARNFKRSPTDFASYLRTQGSSPISMKRQIEGELSWQRLLRRRVEPFVNVGEEEVKAVMDRLQATKGAEEYHVGEIFLSATPETSNEVLANAERIVQQVEGRRIVRRLRPAIFRSLDGGGRRRSRLGACRAAARAARRGCRLHAAWCRERADPGAGAASRSSRSSTSGRC